MTFNTQVLGKAQLEVLQAIGGHLDLAGFYLGGGTAIAIQLGHRRSVDLDWFLPKSMGDPLRLLPCLHLGKAGFRPSQLLEGTLCGRLRGVRLSLFEYCYPMLESAVRWPAAHCRLASLLDLAAMKLAAIAQRGAKRDFVDLYALIQHGISLEEMLRGFRRKYGFTDLAHVLYSLSYFKDADPQRMPTRLNQQKLPWKSIREAIQRHVENLGNI